MSLLARALRLPSFGRCRTVAHLATRPIRWGPASCPAPRRAIAAAAGSDKEKEVKMLTAIPSMNTKEVPLLPARMVKVSPSAGPFKGDLLVIGCHEDEIDALKAMDAKFNGVLAELIAENEFAGKAGSTIAARVGADAKFLAVVGLGDRAKAADPPGAQGGPNAYYNLGAALATQAKANKCKTAAVMLVSGPMTEAAAESVATGVHLGAYESTRFKSKPNESKLETVAVLDAVAGAAAAIDRAGVYATGTFLTRYLVEAPPNVCTPTHLAEAAKMIADQSGGCVTLKVLEKEDCQKLNMGSYLGVAACSEEPPKFIHLTYKPQGEVKKRIALIGKGLTFDSGGYNLKVAGSMIEMMKFDMGGAGAVFGAAKIISELKPANVEVHVIVASCENMIDGKGMRPGDVLVASNGKSIEINNTDAEGRLTLADALYYAEKTCGVQAIVDVATLTGACMVGLGTGIAGMFTYRDDIAHDLTSAARAAGEKIWRLPLEESYADTLKSHVADMKNTGSRWGGSITAALFLKEFVSTDKVEWAHIDMAGPVWDEGAGGATGWGVRTLARWVLSQAEAAGRK